MGWLIALGILILLAALPLGVSIRYDASGALVRLIAGPVRITLFPRAKKKSEEEKTPEKTEPVQEKAPEKKKSSGKRNDAGQSAKKPEKTAEPQTQQKKESGGPITDFLPLVKILLEMLGAFRRKLRMNLLQLKIVMAADDPCDLAVNYGRAWAAVGNLLPQLEKIFVIKKRNIEVECDFEAAKTLATARLDLTITLGRLISLVAVYGVRLLVNFLKINKNRKGGASK